MRYLSEILLRGMSETERALFHNSHLRLGHHPTLKHGLYMPEQARYSGMSMLGLPEQGKSGEMENIAIQDMLRGRSVFYIDPHGDSIKKIIRRLPVHLLHKVYLFDITDLKYPLVMNMLADVDPDDEIELAKAVNIGMHMFEVNWPEVMLQAHFPRYVRMTLLALFWNRDCTLVDMLPFLTNTAFREAKLKAVKDQTVLDFWRRFDEMTSAGRNQQIEPLVTRLEAWFAGRAMIRNLLGHAQNSINLDQFIREGNTLLVPFPLKELEDESKLIGSILIASSQSSLIFVICCGKTGVVR